MSPILKELNRAIEKEMKGFSNPLLSVRGIGPVYAAGILACIGNIKRFSTHNQIAKLAGLVWKRNQSGKFEAQERRLIRQADRYLRYYLVEAANSLSSAQRGVPQIPPEKVLGGEQAPAQKSTCAHGQKAGETGLYPALKEPVIRASSCPPVCTAVFNFVL